MEIEGKKMPWEDQLSYWNNLAFFPAWYFLRAYNIKKTILKKMDGSSKTYEKLITLGHLYA